MLVNAVAPGPIGGDLWLEPGGLADQNAEAKGISRADAGYAIRASAAKIRRLELGQVGPKERDVSDLLEHFDESPLSAAAAAP